MIPQEKNAAVASALREAFGVSAFEDIRTLTTSVHSDPVFRVVVQGSPYLLRIVTRTKDPACHFACMKTAAQAGLAPRVWYTSIEDRISITDFVVFAPFPASDALVRMPNALRSLHAMAPFPVRANHLNTSCTFLMRKGPAVDEFTRQFRASNLLSPAETEELFACYEKIAGAYPHQDPDLVSSHNDLFKPDNILFDGRRVWLVDWEAAFLNDRYADLAVVANLLVSKEEEERLYLHEYFGGPPDEYQMARFFLMQQTSHIFYAMAFLLLGSADKPVNGPENAPVFRDLQRRIWAREANPADKQMKAIYGRAHWEQLAQNIRQPRFTESLQIVSARHARQ